MSVEPWGIAMVWSGLKMGSATVALIGWPSLEVSELSGSSRLAWTIQLPVSVLGGSAGAAGSSQKGRFGGGTTATTGGAGSAGSPTEGKGLMGHSVALVEGCGGEGIWVGVD